LGEYQFTTYRQACARIDGTGRGLLSLVLKKGDKILIYAETRPERLLTVFACFRHGFTLVTLYSTLGEEALKHGIKESQVEMNGYIKLIYEKREIFVELDYETIFKSKRYECLTIEKIQGSSIYELNEILAKIPLPEHY
jgi:acyl-coenzyme A synthetase/AMP-(fatty) acid ligase